MTSAISAGLLLYRQGPAGLEVLIVHPGGPFWSRRHRGAWTIPKGEVDTDEDAAAAAAREFAEELGSPPPAQPWLDLGEIRQKAGKRVRAFAAEGDLDAGSVVSNEVEVEWPRSSGRIVRFPEIDQARWVVPAEATELLNPAQVVLLDRLRDELAL